MTSLTHEADSCGKSACVIRIYGCFASIVAQVNKTMEPFLIINYFFSLYPDRGLKMSFITYGYVFPNKRMKHTP